MEKGNAIRLIQVSKRRPEEELWGFAKRLAEQLQVKISTILVVTRTDTEYWCQSPNRSFGLNEEERAFLEALLGTQDVYTKDILAFDESGVNFVILDFITDSRHFDGNGLHKVQEMCWHCQGQKRCDCIACWQAGPSECVTCKGSGHFGTRGK